MRTLDPFRFLAALVVLSILTLVTPASAGAEDCGAEYAACLAESGALGTSDALHEQECYGDYLDCVASQVLKL